MERKKTIRARVGEGFLAKAPLMFAGGPEQIIEELFQNARRAGATVVYVDTESIDDNRTLVTITDNGCGIEDSQDLLSLSDSAWAEGSVGLESPAGMGFFSLARLSCAVDVRSFSDPNEPGIFVHLTPESFTGISDIDEMELFQRPAGIVTTGTQIQFELGLTKEGSMESSYYCSGYSGVSSLIRSRAKFYPVEVVLNGEKTEQHDYQQYIAEQYEKLSIDKQVPSKPAIVKEDGVTFIVHPYVTPFGVAHATNFYGTAVPINYHSGLRTGDYSVYADIESNAVVDLRLPDRKAVVENGKFAEFRKLAERAIYKAILQEGWKHSLSFEGWKKAKEMGVELPDSAPILKRYTFRQHSSIYGGTVDSWVTKEHMISVSGGKAGDIEIQDPAKYVKLSSDNLSASMAFLYNPDMSDWLLERNRQFKGYAWYDAIPTLDRRSYLFEFDDGVIEIDPSTYEEDGNRDVSTVLREDFGKDINPGNTNAGSGLVGLAVRWYLSNGETKDFKIPVVEDCIADQIGTDDPSHEDRDDYDERFGVSIFHPEVMRDGSREKLEHLLWDYLYYCDEDSSEDQGEIFWTWMCKVMHELFPSEDTLKEVISSNLDHGMCAVFRENPDVQEIRLVREGPKSGSYEIQVIKAESQPA